MSIKDGKIKNPTINGCTFCGKSYRKADYAVCPHCGGDGGNVMGKVWRPSKKEQKEYAKKMNNPQ